MKNHLLAGMIALSIIAAMPQTLRAEDNIEKAGVAVGVSAGNIWFLPLKAVTVSVSALTGALSYSQPDRLNPNHSPLQTAAIAPRTAKYPKRQPSSGMNSKFMP